MVLWQTKPHYGAIKLDIRLNGLRLEEIFVVGRVSEDVIMGILFLAKHQCTIHSRQTSSLY